MALFKCNVAYTSIQHASPTVTTCVQKYENHFDAVKDSAYICGIILVYITEKVSVTEVIKYYCTKHVYV